jgi:hypothetical protein
MGSIKGLDVSCRVAVKAELPTILLKDCSSMCASSSCATSRSSFNFQIEAPQLSGKDAEVVYDRIRPSFNYSTTISTKEDKHVRTRRASMRLGGQYGKGSAFSAAVVGG